MSSIHYTGLTGWNINGELVPVTIKHDGQTWTGEGFNAAAAALGKICFLVHFDPELWNPRKRPPFASRQWLCVDSDGRVLSHDRDQVVALGKLTA